MPDVASMAALRALYEGLSARGVTRYLSQINEASLRRVGRANFGHINFRCTFSFAIDK